MSRLIITAALLGLFFASLTPAQVRTTFTVGTATAALQGDTAKARKAYQDFFALWKDADANVSVLIEARKEYDKLN
jgi:hypothetical protein